MLTKYAFRRSISPDADSVELPIAMASDSSARALVSIAIRSGMIPKNRTHPIMRTTQPARPNAILFRGERNFIEFYAFSGFFNFCFWVSTISSSDSPSSSSLDSAKETTAIGSNSDHAGIDARILESIVPPRIAQMT